MSLEYLILNLNLLGELNFYGRLSISEVCQTETSKKEKSMPMRKWVCLCSFG